MGSVDDLVKKLGGNTAVALVIGKGQTTVSEMKRRGSIPVRYWPKLIGAAHRKGFRLSEADLVCIHAQGEERIAS